MKHLKNLILGSLVALTIGASAKAHTVALGWNVLLNGDVQFFNAHWHGFQTGPAGFLTIDGTNYNFTGVINDTNVISGLEGAVFNTTYFSYSGGSLTAIRPENDYLTVTVSGLSSGNHTFNASSIALTAWSIPSTNGSITFNVPPPANVPDGGSTIALFGAGLAFVIGARRKLKL